jgi:hypothetical protein
MANNKITIGGNNIDPIKELGLEKLPVDVQEKLAERMADIILRRVSLRALEKITDEEAREITGYFDSGNTDKAIEIMDNKVPDFDKIVSEEISLFQQEMAEK